MMARKKTQKKENMLLKLEILLMNQIAVGALELILCRLRATLQGYLFKYLACLQEPPETHLKPIL